MKKYTLFFTVLGALLGFLCFSCQEESSVENNSGALGPYSSLTTLLQTATVNEADQGYIIDSTHCFNIQLPVTVTANGQQVTVSSQSDYNNVASIFSQSSTDTDQLEYSFPIYINYPENNSTYEVNSQQEYNDYLNNCTIMPFQNGCLTISYPITLFGYDSSNQEQHTYIMHSDTQLYHFLINLRENDYYTIKYPLTISMPDPGTLTVSDNDDLLNFLQLAQANCSGN
ncbi:hypothetical protein ACLI1A_16625 [Flavobacterium sp. RHBU_3]|uniref:hypothetical protein n=1 Tax=Flavobacterium sp. RHBU_3 TaxID=3391184 RepID=UPI003985440B